MAPNDMANGVVTTMTRTTPVQTKTIIGEQQSLEMVQIMIHGSVGLSSYATNPVLIVRLAKRDILPAVSFHHGARGKKQILTAEAIFSRGLYTKSRCINSASACTATMTSRREESTMTQMSPHQRLFHSMSFAATKANEWTSSSHGW